ncbi:LOW QUALITY PROTEIN: peroxisomal acyl-coenzyme A oxidase 2 [Amblyraja radiata]|uniref:LOW QUALITY PROTEIN: peroxisomal acyl-coenzyme A oxidase 2 n=1 Tax=Amblyraja radiata TaxID=386614 RepID=UPI0014038221|nr:LOW QUALITY PROTEIN: peroxisomal acyl-coenzyme A oxidase 2 [Amblyraja radiata]
MKSPPVSALAPAVNPDIDSERRASSFDVEKLVNFWDGGAERTRLRRAVEHVINSDPVFSRENQYFLTPTESYEAAVKKSVHLCQKIKELGWTDDGPEVQFAFRILGSELAFGVHNLVFIPTIMKLGTDAQIAKWVPLAKDYHIIGTYAQTELGHGTNLRALETTATFDASSQDFVLNTPKVSSIKWWPGDLGRSASHAVVLAQLYTQGVCHGMHAFIVQVRSLLDHSALPGISVGDIGPKLAFEQVDNGYLRMQNVHIPKDNMLSRYSRVASDGSYIKQGSDRINYISMVFTRVGILSREILPALAKACVIAVRYSAVRRQSELSLGRQNFAFHLMGSSLEAFCKKVNLQIKTERNISSLPELHALSAGMKALMSATCTAGVETCRRACGGHGYSMLSGLPSLYGRVVASCTYEGENTVMLLQTARFLMKCLARVDSGQPLPQSVSYLSEPVSRYCSAKEKTDFFKPFLYTEAYKHRAQRLIKDSGDKLQSLLQSGFEQYVAWNVTSAQLAKTAIAHCQYIVVKNFVEIIEGLKLEAEVQQVIKRLCDLHALTGILSNAGDFLYDGYITGKQLDLVTSSHLDLLALIRTDAVSIVDAFDYSDQQLNSAIGSYDGNSYQHLFEWAQKSPSNAKVNLAYEKYLKPRFQAALSKL